MKNPFGWNVRVKAKVDPAGAMRRAESSPGKYESNQRRNEETEANDASRGPAEADPLIVRTRENSPLWWKEGFRPNEVKEAEREGPDEEPIVTTGREQEFRRFDEEVTPPSMFAQ